MNCLSSLSYTFNLCKSDVRLVKHREIKAFAYIVLHNYISYIIIYIYRACSAHIADIHIYFLF